MEYFVYLLLGLGAGAMYAALGLSVVVAYRTSMILNFATGAMAMYGAYVFIELRAHGGYLIPLVGFPRSIPIAESVPFWPALLIATATTGALGAVIYRLVFRPLRHALPLSRVVASIGVMLVLQALIARRVGPQPVISRPIFPTGTISIGARAVPVDRLYLAGFTVAVSIAVWVVLHATSFGLRSRAVADNEKGAWTIGLSPERVSCASWVLAASVCGLSGVLVSPLVPLTPGIYTLFVVPAFAAALAGRLSAIGPCVVTGFLLGMTESMFSLLQTKEWFPSHLRVGIGQTVPLLVIVGILIFRGSKLPIRGLANAQKLPEALGPLHVRFYGVALPALGLLALGLLDGGYRAALIISMIMAILSLSLVVATGYVGQASLANLAVAGVAAFALTKLAYQASLPFPISAIIAILIAAAIGTVVGLPALRVRGIHLAVVTLAAAVAIDAAYFHNPRALGRDVTGPSLFGFDLGIRGPDYPRLAFGVFVLVVLTATGLGVVWLRCSNLGHRMLAVRSNERAASAAGIDLSKVKITGFAVSSLFAGIAGVLLAYQGGIVSAERFPILAGIGVFALTYLCGITQVSGALLAGLLAPGGLLIVALDRAVDLSSWQALISGLGLILMAINHPRGIAGDVIWAVRRRRAHRDEIDVGPSPTTATLGSSLQPETHLTPDTTVIR